MPGGRPRVYVKRTQADFPPPTPQPTLCRLWQGAIDSDGYGVLVHASHHGSRRRVHRWIWEAVYGPIPAGMVVRHRCDNRVCYRLDHLELGTVADNNRDAAERKHLGPIRAMSPSEVVAVWNRHEAGETYASIHRDYPQYGFATLKRAKDYIAECLDLLTDSPDDDPTTPPTPTAADAVTAAWPIGSTPESSTAPPTTSPPTTTG